MRRALAALLVVAVQSFQIIHASFLGSEMSAEQQLLRQYVSERLEEWPEERRQKLARMVEKTAWGAISASAVMIPQQDGTPFCFVQAGNLPEMWLRDSTASLHHLLVTGVVDQEPYARQVLEGLTRALAWYIGRDPKCSAWEPYDHPRECRGGGTYTDMRFELDSLAYYLRQLRLLHRHGSHALLEDSLVAASVDSVLELVEHLMHPKTYLVSSESRPSDDNIQRGFYHIPDNIFLYTELELLPVGDVDRAKRLGRMVREGVEKYGIRDVGELGKVYCYEVGRAMAPDFAMYIKGMPQQSHEMSCKLMDDANVPSLLSIPYLANFDKSMYDEAVYARTREVVLSDKNKFYFVSTNDEHVAGIGSPHNGGRNLAIGYIWPMSIIMQALTSEDPEEIAGLLEVLMDTDAGTDLMHESFQKDDPSHFTRKWFDWPNALFAELAFRVDETSAALFDRPPDLGAASRGWDTCGFRSDTCELKIRTQSHKVKDPRAPELAPGAEELCARFGTFFGGFMYQRVHRSAFPLLCMPEGGLDKTRLRTISRPHVLQCPNDWAGPCWQPLNPAIEVDGAAAYHCAVSTDMRMCAGLPLEEALEAKVRVSAEEEAFPGGGEAGAPEPPAEGPVLGSHHGGRDWHDSDDAGDDEAFAAAARSSGRGSASGADPAGQAVRTRTEAAFHRLRRHRRTRQPRTRRRFGPGQRVL